MGAWNNPETLWLNVTNAVLGLVCLVAVVAVVTTVGYELLLRFRARRSALAASRDVHAFQIPGLGWTMADGGEPIDDKATNDKPEKPRKD